MDNMDDSSNQSQSDSSDANTIKQSSTNTSVSIEFSSSSIDGDFFERKEAEVKDIGKEVLSNLKNKFYK